MAAKDGTEGRGAVHETDKYRKEESAARGQTIRTEFGRDRSDTDEDLNQEMMGRLTGGTDDASSQIKGGRVPEL